MLTAEIALVSYTILILVGNTVAGLDAVPDSVKEAADGMGYTRDEAAAHRRDPARPADDHRGHPGRLGDRDRARHDRRARRQRRVRRAHQRRARPELPDPDRGRRRAVDHVWRCSSTVGSALAQRLLTPWRRAERSGRSIVNVVREAIEFLLTPGQLDGPARDPRPGVGAHLDLDRRRHDLGGGRHPRGGVARPQATRARTCRSRWSTSAGRSRRSRSSRSSSRSASATGSASASGRRASPSSRSASRRCSRTRTRA